MYTFSYIFCLNMLLDFKNTASIVVWIEKCAIDYKEF